MSIRPHEPSPWTAADADEAAARLLPAWLSAQGAWATVKDTATGRYLAADAALAQRLGLTGGMVGCTDAELVRRVNEIDLRDGRLDGKVANETIAPDCTHCGRKIIGNRPVCLYCGAEAHPTEAEPFRR